MPPCFKIERRRAVEVERLGTMWRWFGSTTPAFADTAFDEFLLIRFGWIELQTVAFLAFSVQGRTVKFGRAVHRRFRKMGLSGELLRSLQRRFPRYALECDSVTAFMWPSLERAGFVQYKPQWHNRRYYRRPARASAQKRRAA
jgi:hypothetical protein